MSSIATGSGLPRLERIQQTVKWMVYTLLLFNFAFYVYEDLTRSAFTLTAESAWFDWTSSFATSLDMCAWLVLLLMFELETYVLDDSPRAAQFTRLIHAIRIVCFIVIAHTVVAFTNTVIDYFKSTPIQATTSLCELLEQDLSYVFNLEYTDITANNCQTLSQESEFFMVGVDPVVSDATGLRLERQLAVADLAEALIWLLILLAIELTVRLQNAGITGGRLIRTFGAAKLMGYFSLMAISIWWACLTHWVYLWDQILWIGGFAIIDMNIRNWRDEIWADEDIALQQAEDRPLDAGRRQERT